MLAPMDSRSCPHMVASWAGTSHLSQNFHLKRNFKLNPKCPLPEFTTVSAFPCSWLIKAILSRNHETLHGPLRFFLSLKLSLFFCFYNWLFKVFTFWVLLCLNFLHFFKGRLSHQVWCWLMIKATYLTALKPEKAALLILFSLSCDPTMQPVSSFHFCGLITYSLIFQPTVQDFSASHKSILYIFFISIDVVTASSPHQLIVDSGTSYCAQSPPSSSWYCQYLHRLLTS